MTHAIPEFTVEQLEAEGRVDLAHFDNADAFALGTIATGVIAEWGVNLGVDIVVDGYLAYRARLGSTGVGNDPWLAGKAAVANHFGVSSLLVRLRQEATGVPFTDLELDHDVMRAHGGSVPIFVAGSPVATITMSGEPDVVDHETARESLDRYLASLS
ncbi:MAG: heme-binding protein [Galbitalea sp.]